MKATFEPNPPPLPRAFSAEHLARYLGTTKHAVLKMGFPKHVFGHRTHLYFLDEVLQRIEELKKEGVIRR